MLLFKLGQKSKNQTIFLKKSLKQSERGFAPAGVHAQFLSPHLWSKSFCKFWSSTKKLAGSVYERWRRDKHIDLQPIPILFQTIQVCEKKGSPVSSQTDIRSLSMWKGVYLIALSTPACLSLSLDRPAASHCWNNDLQSIACKTVRPGGTVSIPMGCLSV